MDAPSTPPTGRTPDPEAGPDPDAELVCATCGATPAPEQRAAARLTWSRGSDGGRSRWTCDRCSREHLRSIEGKLDPAWW
ncbi:hypothetical protein GCM10023258_21710 [Terrabacter aeriphilus]|uniref:Uncharacterized protein n=1 Tax=Terrabacter aeriphilus TaxID=515662 RepID=A0ABP9JEV8_9MICO